MNTSGSDTAKQGTFALSIAAIGVVFGDIGTSPLYTMREAFSPRYGLAPSTENVLGVLSLIFWALMIVVTAKYVFFMMRANNRGEGGMMALLALVLRATKRGSAKRILLISLGLFGASMFYGDGMITPAISVISAVEGLGVAAPALQPFVIPLTIVIVILLFSFQQKGTASVGALFGPVTVVWFAVIGLLGAVSIVQNLAIFAALSPTYAVQFFLDNRFAAFLAMGAVVLAITGTEGIYTDMGHFGKKPIRIAWSFWVLPALLLNYFGQGALILRDPAALEHPFYRLAPEWALYPLIGLATAATVIASQAVISGTYSLTRQAIQLGYCPRMDIHHTSESEIGQIYMPWINWSLLVAVIILVVTFGSSSNLASAYGVAVTGMMAIDTILAFVVVTTLWNWSKWIAAPLAIAFLCIDLTFFSANTVKLVHGGWFPIVVAMVLFTVFTTWYRGRQILMHQLAPGAIGVEPFVQSITQHPPTRVPGTAVFLTTATEGVPHALLHNLNHNKVLHERIVLLTVLTEEVPHVPNKDRIEITPLSGDFFRIVVRYGFKDQPDVPAALELAAEQGLEFKMMETSFFLSRQTLVPKLGQDMALWREKLFAVMSRNASSATGFFNIPANRVVELGTRVEL
ncbi:MAG: potassium transporter Kup [Betaproteobacteria bacterium]|nr:MAG: potassium transporter Kup [Betaproteobacteria bacterium]